jgi:hypothetical protein
MALGNYRNHDLSDLQRRIFSEHPPYSVAKTQTPTRAETLAGTALSACAVQATLPA